jgi:hypothetical protein
MQYPNYKLYKFFEDKIDAILGVYVKQFVELNNQLLEANQKIGFLSPPFDISKLYQGEQAFDEYSSVLKAYEKTDKSKIFHVQCFLGDVANTDSVKLDFVPSPIAHAILNPNCIPTISRLHIDQENYRENLLKNKVASVTYCVGEQFRGYLVDVYLLGKIFSNQKLAYLLEKNNHKYNVPILKEFIKHFNGIVEEDNHSVVISVDDDTNILKEFLKEWDMKFLDSMGSGKLQTILSNVDLNLNVWLTK